MKEDVCHKPRISFKSAFKLALNDLKTCPSRQNQKLQGRKWPYFSNWTLGLRVMASLPFTLGTFLHLFWKEIALLQNLSRGKTAYTFSPLSGRNHTWHGKILLGLTLQPHNLAINCLFGHLISQACRA